MHVLFEEAGKFMAGRVLSEAEASSQVELDSGKRVKVKAANILIKFEKPAPAELLAQAAAVAQTIELELAWEFAPEGEFSFADLARDYFSADATLAQQAGALFRLFEAPHYFRRAGKGRFKKAPAEILQQALAAIEKKKQSSSSRSPTGPPSWPPAAARSRSASSCTRSCSSRQERARVQGRGRGLARHPAAPLDLLQRPAPSTRPTSSTGSASCSTISPRAPVSGAGGAADHRRPAAGRVQAYSIDDSQTTEIDDALSLQGLGSGTVVLGIHIAAPGLAISPAAPSTSWRASACPPSTCRATRSPCCPTTWCRPTP
jgi:exoribonuclease-2